MKSAKPKRKTAKHPGEGALVDRVRRAFSAPGSASSLRIAIGDDAAVWRPTPGHEIILTCDWFLEGTHFLLDRHPAHSVGWKALARAASDLAAMGAVPCCFLLSLALPVSLTGEWLEEFLRGLRAASQNLNCPAAGGDTTRRDRVLISLTVVGECRDGRAILRSGARPGDALFVSGRLGEAEYGLRLIRQNAGRLNSRDPHLRKHLYPQPRLAVGTWLAERRLASAMLDLSDGLSTDLPRLCQASAAGARLEAQRIPCPGIPKVDARKVDPLSLAIHGGDDYELLFTVPPRNISQIPRRIAGVPVTLIGHITREKQILLVAENRNKSPLPQKGWDPFKK
jgi:thiamine-monophosphate kinase